MPTSEIERALAAGAARSREAAGPARDGVREARTELPAGRLGDWYRALPPERRKLIVGIGLFLLLDLIAGFAVVASGAHF